MHAECSESSVEFVIDNPPGDVYIDQILEQICYSSLCMSKSGDDLFDLGVGAADHGFSSKLDSLGGRYLS
jgi:hypothetical protein